VQATPGVMQADLKNPKTCGQRRLLARSSH
jgi:hypothetical protein